MQRNVTFSFFSVLRLFVSYVIKFQIQQVAVNTTTVVFGDGAELRVRISNSNRLYPRSCSSFFKFCPPPPGILLRLTAVCSTDCLFHDWSRCASPSHWVVCRSVGPSFLISRPRVCFAFGRIFMLREDHETPRSGSAFFRFVLRFGILLLSTAASTSICLFHVRSVLRALTTVQ